MNKKKVSLLPIFFSLFLFISNEVHAFEQPNFDSNKQTIVFHLTNKKTKTEYKKTINQNNSAHSKSRLPKLNDTSLILISFIGTLLVGFVLLVINHKRRHYNES